MYVQTVRHKDAFLEDDALDVPHSAPARRDFLLALGLLPLSLLSVVLLAEVLDHPVEAAILRSGFPEALIGVVILVGMVASFFFCVFFLDVSAGIFISGMTVVTGVGDVFVSVIKAFLFGLASGLIACYKGISVGGGPAGVGNAVNETVVMSFMVLFTINIIVTAVGVQFTVK